ncbi:hypothetical protein LCGC14_1099130 [marine sediment metagenome]|uniref:Uncharacterized protein n=1 Tax=marine sediment metagenome TaxID=412755 RepID=A0A0F9MA11_9ZZZZ
MATPRQVERCLRLEMLEAERKAFDSLSRYKFLMFGYWAGVWVNLNNIGGYKRPNPFAALVAAAKKKQVAK